MTHMTPEQAQQSLARYRPRQLTPGGHYDNNTGYRALTALSADTLEYGLTFADESTVYWVGDDRHAAEVLREAWINRGSEVGPLVCRRVSQPWEVADEH